MKIMSLISVPVLLFGSLSASIVSPVGAHAVSPAESIVDSNNSNVLSSFFYSEFANIQAMKESLKNEEVKNAVESKKKAEEKEALKKQVEQELRKKLEEEYNQKLKQLEEEYAVSSRSSGTSRNSSAVSRSSSRVSLNSGSSSGSETISCQVPSGDSSLSPWVGQVRTLIGKKFGISNIGGTRPGDPQDHGKGLALDVMVPVGGSIGDEIAQWAVDNIKELNISYIIWEQKIYNVKRPGWRVMEDRGSITANHYDHVHISFKSGSGTCVS